MPEIHLLFALKICLTPLIDYEGTEIIIHDIILIYTYNTYKHS